MTDRIETIADGVTLYLGDCREILPTIGKVDAIVTDPPYGVRADEEWDRKTDPEMMLFSMDWATKASAIASELVSFDSGYSPLRRTLEMLWPRVRVMIWDKPNGSQYAGSSERGLWFAHEPIYHCYAPNLEKSLEVGAMLKQAREAAGLSRGAVDMVVRGKKTGLCFRWEEGACLPTKEQIEKVGAVLPLNGEFSALIDAARGRTTDTEAQGRDVFSHRTVSGAVHSCEKPITLMRELITRLFDDDTTILDPFMGSGTTGVAAVKLGRKFIGIELETKNFDIARRRIDDAMRTPDMFIQRPKPPTTPDMFGSP